MYEFNYRKVDSVAAAVEAMQQAEDGKFVAGGQTMLPTMKHRLASPSDLIDLGGVDALKGISIDGRSVTIGAMTTQHELISNDALAKVAPIIREASLQIADPQVRYLGTIGGNVANGDPANDMPGLMQTLDATYHLAGPGGARTVAARDFYEAAYFTAREDDEILTGISFTASGGGYAYEKQKRKIGDYATAAAGVLLTMEGGSCTAASVALTNLSDTPVYCADAVDALVGSPVDDPTVKAAVTAAVDASDPVADTRGPVDFKKYVAGVIVKKAIESARARA